MIKIILDTNFLVYCAENKIDFKERISEIVDEGYGLVVPNLVVIELKRLVETAVKLSDREAAGLALKMLEKSGAKIVQVESRNADGAIIKLSKGNIVATLDFELRKKLKESRVLVVEGHKKIAFR